jgi:hypothetical protein
MYFRSHTLATVALSLIALGLSSFAHAADLEPVPGYPTLEVDFVELINYFEYEKVRTRKIGREMATVLNSREFKERVLNFEWNGAKQYADNDGYTNEQIYDMIRTARENDNPDGRDSVMELVHKIGRPWFCSWRKAIGFTNPGSPLITTYYCKYHRMSDADLGGHFTHEWMHRIGFGHDFNATAKRPHSVPYAVGRIAGQILDEMLGTQSVLNFEQD